VTLPEYVYVMYLGSEIDKNLTHQSFSTRARGRERKDKSGGISAARALE